MTCKNCGTEIADKALICYRCGTATSEAKFKPAAIRPVRSRTRIVVAVVLIVLLVLLAFFLLHSGSPSTIGHSSAFPTHDTSIRSARIPFDLT